MVLGATSANILLSFGRRQLTLTLTGPVDWAGASDPPDGNPALWIFSRISGDCRLRLCVVPAGVVDRLSRLSQSDAGRWVELPTDFRSPGVAKGGIALNRQDKISGVMSQRACYFGWSFSARQPTTSAV
jgi:hypothetical protein